jgi:hypothetical protein
LCNHWPQHDSIVLTSTSPHFLLGVLLLFFMKCSFFHRLTHLHQPLPESPAVVDERHDEWVPGSRLVADNEEGKELKRRLEEQAKKEKEDAAARAKEKKRLSAPPKQKKVLAPRVHKQYQHPPHTHTTHTHTHTRARARTHTCLFISLSISISRCFSSFLSISKRPQSELSLFVAHRAHTGEGWSK